MTPEPPRTQRDEFIHALARFLVDREARMSIGLQGGGNTEAQQWSALRNRTPLVGYYPGPEGLVRAERELRKFLGVD
jgi:hypothetical protein